MWQLSYKGYTNTDMISVSVSIFAILLSASTFWYRHVGECMHMCCCKDDENKQN